MTKFEEWLLSTGEDPSSMYSGNYNILVDCWNAALGALEPSAESLVEDNEWDISRVAILEDLRDLKVTEYLNGENTNVKDKKDTDH